MNNKLKSQRQDSILNEVLRRGTVSIGDLAAFLKVSEITVRRDLDELHASGSLERVRGGARPLSVRGPEPPIIQRAEEQTSEKQAIGQAALAVCVWVMPLAGVPAVFRWLVVLLHSLAPYANWFKCCLMQ